MILHILVSYRNDVAIKGKVRQTKLQINHRFQGCGSIAALC